MNNIEPVVKAITESSPNTGVIIVATAAIVVVGMALVIILKMLPRQS